MFWVIFFSILLLILLWPHWLGAAYENEITRYIWIIPPFTFKITKRRFIILFFNKELKLFNQEKRRRKAVKKKSDDRKRSTIEESSIESVYNVDENPTTDTLDDFEKEVSSKSITPLPSSITKNRSEIKPLEKKESTSAKKTPEAASDKTEKTETRTDSESSTTSTDKRDFKESVSSPESKAASDDPDKTSESSSDFELPGYRFIREKISNVKHYLFTIWETEKKFITSNWRWLIRFLKISYRFIKPITFRVYLKGGTGDPAETGTIYGFIQSLSLSKKNYYTNYIEYTPDFGTTAQWDAKGDILWRTSIAAVLLWIFVTLFTFPYIQAYKFYKRRNNGNVQNTG